MILVILDGPHAGLQTNSPMPIPPPNFAVNAPGPITWEEFVTPGKSLKELREEKPDQKVVYHIAFVSVDHKVALYSTTGDSEDFLKNSFILKNWTETSDSDLDVIEDEQAEAEQERKDDRRGPIMIEDIINRRGQGPDTDNSTEAI